MEIRPVSIGPTSQPRLRVHEVLFLLVGSANVSSDVAADDNYATNPQQFGKISPQYNVHSPNITCGRNAFDSAGKTETADVIAGETIGFQVSDAYRPGVSAPSSTRLQLSIFGKSWLTTFALLIGLVQLDLSRRTGSGLHVWTSVGRPKDVQG